MYSEYKDKLHFFQKKCNSAVTQKQENKVTKDFRTNAQKVIHHWPWAEKVTGQPQLTSLALIVPRCNQPHSVSPRATDNTLLRSQYAYFTSCPSALWRRSCHCWDAKSIAELEQGWNFSQISFVLVSYVNTFGSGKISRYLSWTLRAYVFPHV